MITLITNLPLMIGDLIPENDSVWEYVITLVELSDLLLLNELSRTQCELIGSLIHRHHELYIQLFDKNLKPKHHFMTHYASVIKIVGPLKHIWSMRLEAFHKILKNISNATASRKNIALTIPKKTSLCLRCAY